MDEDADTLATDTDQLYTLPLCIIPLDTAGLRRARLIKNSRLEGVVELFTSREAGSGQVRPDELHKVFDELQPKHKDFQVVKALSKLPSYDVYSLRIELRALGIDISESENLQLSNEKIDALSAYMKAFTRPLLSAVYGNDEGYDSFTDMISATATGNLASAKQNLTALSEKLDTDVSLIPNFLQDYGDVYLSLAYYQFCLDNILPHVVAFLEQVKNIKTNPNFRSELNLMRTLSSIEWKVNAVSSDIGVVLEMFRARTDDMWQDISSDKFGKTRKVILSYHTKIGGALCALTVKMNAWSEMFPDSESGGIFRRVDFIMSDIRPGIENLENIDYSDIA